MGNQRVVAKLVGLIGRSEFNEATEPAMRATAIAALRQDCLRALCTEYAPSFT